MTKPISLYLSGPMTGFDEFNHPYFSACASELRSRGYEILNPSENTAPECGTWSGWMRKALRQLLDADAIVLLSGWQISRGARVEFNLACELSLHVLPYEQLLLFDVQAKADPRASLLSELTRRTVEAGEPLSLADIEGLG